MRGAAAGEPHVRLLPLPRHPAPLPPLRRLRLGLLLDCHHRSAVLPSRLALPHHRIPLLTFSFPKTRQGFLNNPTVLQRILFHIPAQTKPEHGRAER